MKVKCIMCGKEEEITKFHKDYRKLEANPAAVYVCESCAMLITQQASQKNILEQQ